MDTDLEIYKGKKFSGLIKDVVSNSEQKRAQIELLIDELRQMIKTPNDAMVIVPLIKEYLDVGVKNDEQLVKLAAVVQRILTNQGQGENTGIGLTEDEKKSLMSEVEAITKEMNKPITIPK